ncbi:unnamed protein product [Closterium sp. NIES-65]|nr:unnamed protein product [Closterium sp. NIES-65]
MWAYAHDEVHWALEWTNHTPIPRVGVHLPYMQPFRVATKHSGNAPRVIKTYIQGGAHFSYEGVCHALPAGELPRCDDVNPFSQRQIWQYAMGCGPVAGPIGPVAAPSGPVAAPSGPVAALHGPIAAPSGPVAALRSPVAALRGPVAASSGPVAALRGPVAASNGPVAALHGPVAASSGPVTGPHGPFSRQAAEPPSYRAAGPPSRRAAAPSSRPAAEPPGSRAAEPPSRATEPPSHRGRRRAATTEPLPPSRRRAATVPTDAPRPYPPGLVRALPARPLLSWLPPLSLPLMLRAVLLTLRSGSMTSSSSSSAIGQTDSPCLISPLMPLIPRLLMPTALFAHNGPTRCYCPSCCASPLTDR